MTSCLSVELLPSDISHSFNKHSWYNHVGAEGNEDLRVTISCAEMKRWWWFSRSSLYLDVLAIE